MAKFTKKDYQDAMNQIQKEWRNFDVPKLIHDRIIELAWEGTKPEVVVKIIMGEFEAKECYANKCYHFSDAFKFERERYARIGMYFICDVCTESCIPRSCR